LDGNPIFNLARTLLLKSTPSKNMKLNLTLFYAVYAAASVFALSSTVYCNGFRNPPEGAVAQGQIGGKVANIDDASAISHNPANLVEVERSFLATTTLILTEVDFQSTAGQKVTTKRPIKVLPSAFALWPLEDKKCVLGLGITTPFGQSTVWGQKSIFRYPIPWFAELKVININPTFAAQVTDDLSVGVGADLFLSELDLRQFFAWSALTGDITDSDGEARFLGQGFGAGGNLGVTWKFAKNQRLALTYRSAVDVEYDGSFHLSNLPPASKLPPPFRGVTSAAGYHTGIQFPNIVTLGYGIQLSDTLKVGSDIEWVQFSSYHTLRTDIENNNVLLPSTTTNEDWDDIWTFGVGGSWNFKPKWVARAGYQFLQTPIPDQTLSPTLPDADKHAFSVGLGYSQKSYSMDVSYMGMLYDERRFIGNQNPAFNGSYDLTSHLFAASFRLSF
jgi:long-chain fatty acid transport protein